jgi:DDE_Tnp_1-associated
MPNGIPSHDTFNRVFARLDPQQFRTCFTRWVSATSTLIGDRVIAIDGKVLRRSHDKGIGQAAIDRVSAWASANQVVLGKVKVDDKSNEIRAILQLLRAAVLRHISLNLLKQEKTCKQSIRGKRLLAGWQNDYLLKVLVELGQVAE